MGLRFLASVSLAFITMPSLGVADQLQRKCVFELGIKENGTFDTKLAVTIAIEGNRGAVAVKGSGTYQARIRKSGDDIRFRTPVSTETITISAQGEAIWQISFDDGRTKDLVIGYAGHCGKAR